MPLLTKAIIDILTTHPIKTHEELSELLTKKGIPTTQATISRRMKALGVQKRHGLYTLENPSTTAHTILRTQCSDYGQIILHTQPGCASSIAYTIDQTLISPTSTQHCPHLLASISGDDTVLLITQNQKFVPEIFNALQTMFPGISINSTSKP